jgi:hypothetical protein
MTTNSQTVEQFIDSLEHRFKAEIIALRQLILGVDQSISEEI